MAKGEFKRKGTQRSSQRPQRDFLCVPSPKPLRPLPLKLFLLVLVLAIGTVNTTAQTRRRKGVAIQPTQQRVPSVAKYSAFLHSSDKHKSLACNSCHKVPTVWTAKRAFPDVADFPNHDACVRCHRQQFFTRQAFAGAGPAICTVCHVRAAPREDGRFAFGKPNVTGQAIKARDERQFKIEFPHDKHQNVIASAPPDRNSDKAGSFIRASFFRSQTDDQKKPDYNNCTICHQRNDRLFISARAALPDTTGLPNVFFKTRPNSHDSCFNCHWKNQKPAADDCEGCHKPAATFVVIDRPERKSAMFNHEGGGEGVEHVIECTTCHINITRAGTLRGLTPDVPIVSCATCHIDKKTITYKNIVTIETELTQFKKTGECHYCHTPDVGKKKPPASHEAAVKQSKAK
jgi:hypothetical protein